MKINRKEKIRRLQRRADFLLARINDDNSKDLTYDKSEYSALVWAIEQCEELERMYDYENNHT